MNFMVVVTDEEHQPTVEEAVFRKTLDVNLVGPFLCTQIVAKEMIERKIPGSIVFITSLAVRVASPSQVDYAASKGGVHMLMKGFSTALGPHGIRCNGLAPGWIYTDMTKFHWDKPENQETARKRLPMQRLGTPTDIGRAWAFLASSGSGYVNGHNLVVDGGYFALSG